MKFLQKGLLEWEDCYFHFFQKDYWTKICVFPPMKKRYVLKENTIGSHI